MRPSLREDLTVIELDGEAVVYDDVSGEVHHLNPSATIVLSLCDGSTTIEEMTRSIAEASGLSADELAGQIRAAIDRFGAAGLLA